MENILANIRNENTELFSSKMQDYGASWRILRPVSFIDQMMIKIKRLRTIQEPGYVMQVDEPQSDAFIALYNYSIMALINYENGYVDDVNDEKIDQLISAFKMHSHEAHLLQLSKDQDYGSAWLNLSVETITDLIMQKLMRASQIIKNNGETKVSEGISGSYYDIANYSVFALYKLIPAYQNFTEPVYNNNNNIASIIDTALSESDNVKVDEKMSEIMSDIKTVYNNDEPVLPYFSYWKQTFDRLGFISYDKHKSIYTFVAEIGEYTIYVDIDDDIKDNLKINVYQGPKDDHKSKYLECVSDLKTSEEFINYLKQYEK